MSIRDRYTECVGTAVAKRYKILGRVSQKKFFHLERKFKPSCVIHHFKEKIPENVLKLKTKIIFFSILPYRVPFTVFV